jgi:hypothetical protein
MARLSSATDHADMVSRGSAAAGPNVLWFAPEYARNGSVPRGCIQSAQRSGELPLAGFSQLVWE